MLRKWHEPGGDAYWAENFTDELDGEILTLDEGPACHQGKPAMGGQLDARQ